MVVRRVSRRCWRLMVRAARELWTGLVYFGATFAGVTLTAPEPEPAPEPDEPPAGHPERLVPDVPLTPAERWLWSQLDR